MVRHSHLSIGWKPAEAGWGLVCSGIVHASVVLALGLILLPAGARPRIDAVVDSTWDAADDATQYQQIRSPAEVAPTQAPTSMARDWPAAAGAGGSQVRLDLTVPTPAAEEQVSSLSLGEGVAVGAGFGPSGSGRGGGGGAGQLAGPGFFPTDPDRRRFVFVVDASQSMNHPWPGPAKSRLGRVKVELWKSIFSMSAEQSYAIVFFNTNAIPMPGDGLRSGGPEGQQEQFQWTVSIRADGKTDPQDALLHALKLRPDVIYFLTDGEFNYRVVHKVARVNTNGVIIHTVSLGDRSAERFLKEMAQQADGEYRHIEADEDHYWTEEDVQPSAEVTSR
jgi:hypothetical protein